MLELYVFDEGASETETVMFDISNLKYYLVAKGVLVRCSTFPANPNLYDVCKYYVPENDATEISHILFPIKMKRGNDIILEDARRQQFEVSLGWSFENGEVYVSKSLRPFGCKTKLGGMLYVPHYKIDRITWGPRYEEGVEKMNQLPPKDEDNFDPVQKPSHYNKGGVECIEAIKASMTDSDFKGYLKGNIEKYLWRYEKKDNPIQDLEKAKWYLERLIKECKEDK